MAAEVHLYRFDENLEERLIPLAEWQSAIGDTEDVRLIETRGGFDVEAYEEDEDSWQLILLLDSSGRASSRLAHLLDGNGFVLIKLMQLAQQVSAAISDEEGNFYYLPEWHDYFWNADELEPVVVTSDELASYKQQFGMDKQHIEERLTQIRLQLDL